jgi:hypothetical protein
MCLDNVNWRDQLWDAVEDNIKLIEDRLVFYE